MGQLEGMLDSEEDMMYSAVVDKQQLNIDCSPERKDNVYSVYMCSDLGVIECLLYTLEGLRTRVG